jgi:hypothetical protein
VTLIRSRRGKKIHSSFPLKGQRDKRKGQLVSCLCHRHIRADFMGDAGLTEITCRQCLQYFEPWD